MRMLFVGAGPETSPLAEELEAAGVAVERAPADTAPGGGEIAELAAGLRAFERLLGGDRPDAVLLLEPSNAALAALLVAAKLRVPVARVEDDRFGADRSTEVNRALIGALADAPLAAGADAILAWVRKLEH